MKHHGPSSASTPSPMPHAVTCFSLAPLTVPYEKWNGQTQLLRDGQPTTTFIGGCDLKAQYQAGDHYLLITEYDCPYEEAVTLTLLSQDLKPLARVTLPQVLYPVVGLPSYFFEKLVWHDSKNFDLHIKDLPHYYRYTIRDFSIPFIYPRLTKRLIRHPS